MQQGKLGKSTLDYVLELTQPKTRTQLWTDKFENSIERAGGTSVLTKGFGHEPVTRNTYPQRPIPFHSFRELKGNAYTPKTIDVGKGSSLHL